MIRCHNHNSYITITKVASNITGKNQTELSTPMPYASDRIKKIDTNNVMRSLYFIWLATRYFTIFYLYSPIPFPIYILYEHVGFGTIFQRLRFTDLERYLCHFHDLYISGWDESYIINYYVSAVIAQLLGIVSYCECYPKEKFNRCPDFKMEEDTLPLLY